MLRLLLANQRGGVGKTSTAINLMRYLSDQGMRVLLIDTDPQASVSQVLGLKHKNCLADFLVHHLALPDCVTPYSPKADVLISNRETYTAEAWLIGQQAREMILHTLITPWESNYDAVLIDSAPSIGMLQSCAIYYTRQVLIPVDMDHLSVTGALSTQLQVQQINALTRIAARIVALLPTRVDRRLGMSQLTLSQLAHIAKGWEVPVLPEIRTDASVGKCLRAHKALADYDPECKAWVDYKTAFAVLVECLRGEEVAI